MRLRLNIFLVVLLVATVSLFAGASTTVRGEVFDMTGAPIPKTSIGLYSADGDWNTQTNSEGKFAITDVPSGTYELEVKAQGFIPRLIQDVKVGQSEPPPMNVKLTIGSCPPCCGNTPTCTVADVTYSETDTKPMLKGKVFSMCEISVIAGVNLALYKPGENRITATSRTDEHGEFVFTGLDPGRYNLRISREGYPDSWDFNLRIEQHKLSTVKEEFGMGLGGVVSPCPN